MRALGKNEIIPTRHSAAVIHPQFVQRKMNPRGPRPRESQGRAFASTSKTKALFLQGFTVPAFMEPSASCDPISLSSSSLQICVYSRKCPLLEKRHCFGKPDREQRRNSARPPRDLPSNKNASRYEESVLVTNASQKSAPVA